MVQTKRRAALDESQVTNQPVAIYARVSTEDQAERETIQSQLDFLRRFVDLHNLPVAGEYIDDGISGAVPLGNRPEGQRLLIDAEAGRVGSVLVFRLSRLGRTLRAIVDAHDALALYDVAIKSATEPFDTSTPVGILFFQMLASFAEYDRNVISENTSRGRNRVAGNGQYTGGPIATGYDVDDANRFILSERIVPELGITEAEMIRGVFERVASGESTLNAEGARLVARGVPNRQRYGGKDGRVIERPGHWRNSTLTQMIHNPMYKGEAVLDSQYGAVSRPVPALVDAETWQRAQEALTRNRTLSRKNAKNTYLLRGLIRCADCGMGYTGTTTASLCGGERISRRRYRCNSQVGRSSTHPEGRCGAKVLPADWIEDAVWEECRQFILNPGDALDEARRKLRERMAESTRFDTERRATLDALAEKETERERVLTMYRRGKIDAEEAERELDAIAREAGQLREDLESMRAQSALLDIQEAHLTESAALLDRLRGELAEIDASNDQIRKHEVIEAYVRKITVQTHRIGPRKLHADVRLHLRLKPDPIAVDTTTPWPGGWLWRRSGSTCRSGVSTGVSG
jgi:site-specific DNA recombinase